MVRATYQDLFSSVSEVFVLVLDFEEVDVGVAAVEVVAAAAAAVEEVVALVPPELQ